LNVNSTRPRRRRKRTDRPHKPYPEFPLQPHGSGQWTKRVHGRLCYFGKWAKPSLTSIMPEGLQATISVADLRDLVTFLTQNDLEPAPTSQR